MQKCSTLYILNLVYVIYVPLNNLQRMLYIPMLVTSSHKELDYQCLYLVGFRTDGLGLKLVCGRKRQCLVHWTCLKHDLAFLKII